MGRVAPDYKITNSHVYSRAVSFIFHDACETQTHATHAQKINATDFNGCLPGIALPVCAHALVAHAFKTRQDCPTKAPTQGTEYGTPGPTKHTWGNTYAQQEQTCLSTCIVSN